jgi:hypothetical protein
MKITLKTLQQQSFIIEIDPSLTVSSTTDFISMTSFSTHCISGQRSKGKDRQ